MPQSPNMNTERAMIDPQCAAELVKTCAADLTENADVAFDQLRKSRRKTNTYNMHLIINTHWDREYRWSFPETQFRLAEAVDDLIDIMQNDERFAYFHTDSQVSMLDDYLEIRPERAEELKELVREGRILTGPWYTLPAEFLVSGESLVRNLLMGHQIAENLGKVMKAAYNIFSWGQVSQLPQIYKQFGMDTIVFYRGIDQSSLPSLEFLWKAPDGTESLGITFGSYHRLNFWRYVYLPYILGEKMEIGRSTLGKDGFLFNLCDSESGDINHQILNQPCVRDIHAALEGMDELLGTVAPKSSVEDLLFLQGFDQENPDPIVTDLIDEINEKIDYGHLQVGNLPDYMAQVKETLLRRNIMEKLPVREGEMLDVEKTGDPFGPLYNGVFSARMPLKRMNAACQYALERWAEPAAAWNLLLGNAYPAVSLRNAWKEVLKNQQHDGIGGCHVDRVTKTMEERYTSAKEIGETVTRNSLRDLTCRIDFSHLGDREIGLVVYNPTQYARGEMITVSIDVPREWEFRYKEGHYRRDFGFKVTDHCGNRIGAQLLAIEDDTAYSYLKFGNVFKFDTARCTLVIEARDIPPMGYATFTISPELAIPRPVEVLSPETNVLENEYLRAEIGQNGTISLTDKQTGVTHRQLHYFEDAGDKGGPLLFDMPYENGVYNTLTMSPSVSLVYNGPLYAKYCIVYEWQLPESICSKVKIHVPHGTEWVDQGRLQRSARKKTITIRTEVLLRKNSRQLEFVTTVDNTVCDHRLRVMLPTGLTHAEYGVADSPFDVVRRPISVPDSSGWYESAARTWPTQSLVSVADDNSRVTVVHRGLSEYEITDNPSRTICLTLLRAIGTAGNPTELYQYQELAQCLGEHTFQYALFVGEAATGDSAELMAEAIAVNVPLRAAQTTRHCGDLEARKSFFTVSSPRFVVTAVKKAETGDGLIIRGYNASDDRVDLFLRFDSTVLRAMKVTLEEKAIEPLTVVDNRTIAATVGKKEIATFLVECQSIGVYT